ncbi:hypothetical protein ACRALDRAFT_1060837 [Sodiomyces alcalophilus JCM 7366]|uniref:uncharacterized protein n=1 Tax=Sodiomyces alcalophilus JCM 7366 TaxID=591952 RepID=UPI0039B5014B
MATQAPLSNPTTPVTPPPEHHIFGNPGPQLPPYARHNDFKAPELRAQSPPSFLQPHPYNKIPTILNNTPAIPRGQTDTQEPRHEDRENVSSNTGGSHAKVAPLISPNDSTQGHQQSQQQPEQQQQPQPPQQQQPLDPRYLTMASQIASYYQQRCQAISNAQQQRCQAWANMHRQKCQEAMQAAMLVVAWYIRDRIQRRRRKEKRKFRAGLRARNQAPQRSRHGGGGDPRESVCRWLMQLPEDPVSPDVPPVEAGPEKKEKEKEPAVDGNFGPEDDDAKLYDMADRLIKSQSGKVGVPMLGMLSFEESDGDTESEDEHAAASHEVQHDTVTETGSRIMYESHLS